MGCTMPKPPKTGKLKNSSWSIALSAESLFDPQPQLPIQLSTTGDDHPDGNIITKEDVVDIGSSAVGTQDVRVDLTDSGEGGSGRLIPNTCVTPVGASPRPG